MAGPKQSMDAQIERWMSRLLDLTRRNQLVSMKLSKRAAVEVLHPPAPEAWARLLDGRSRPLTFVHCRDVVEFEPEVVEADESAEDDQRADEASLRAALASPGLRADHALGRLDEVELDRKLHRLSLTAKTSLTELGVNTLFAAFGFLHRYESNDSDVRDTAPLLLLPVRLSRPNADARWTLSLFEDAVEPNRTLGHLLQHQYGVELPEPPEGDGQPGELLDFLAAVEEAVSGMKRWLVEPRWAVGTFAFQKVAMWQDLMENRQAIAAHPICRAIAGDRDAAASLPVPDPMPTADTVDEVAPVEATFQILDADSSQRAAIAAVRGGANLVIDGPPGTGKSQTIANLIADCLADGRTVLFVSEKAVALEVVKRRLDDAGLGDFCLECHSDKANKLKVVQELARGLLRRPPAGQEAAHTDELAKVQVRLDAYVAALHRPASALDLTPYEVHGRLATLGVGPTSRQKITDVFKVDASQLDKKLVASEAAAGVADIIAVAETHPWRGASAEVVSLSLLDDIRHEFAKLREQISSLIESVRPLNEAGFLGDDYTLAQARQAAGGAASIGDMPKVPAAWMRANPERHAKLVVAASDLPERRGGIGRLMVGGLADGSAAICQRRHALRRRLIHDLRRHADVIRGRHGLLRGAVARIDEEQADRRARLAEYHDAAAAEVDVALAEVLWRPAVPRPAEARTIREEIAAVEEVQRDVAIVVTLAAEATAAWARACSSAGSEDPPPPVERAPRWRQFAAALRAAGRPPAVWTDVERREAARRVIPKLAKAAGDLRERREALQSRVAPGITSNPEAAELAEGMARPRSWLGRLLPAYRRLRSRWRAAYVSPTTAGHRELAEDAAGLLRWRRDDAAMRAEHEAAGDMLRPLREDGPVKADWSREAELLDQVEALAAVAPAGSAFSAEALSRVPEADLHELADALDEYAAKGASLRERLNLVAAKVTGRPVATGGSLEELRADGLELRDELSERAAALAHIAGLLRAGADVPLAELRRDINRLRDHARVEREMTEILWLANGLPELPPSTPTEAGGDAPAEDGPSDEAPADDPAGGRVEVARWLINLFQQHGGSPPQGVVAVLSDPRLRERVEAAVASFDQAAKPSEARQMLDDLFPQGFLAAGDKLEQTEAVPLRVLPAWLGNRIDDAERLREWVEYVRARKQMHTAGLMRLWDELHDGDVPAAEAKPALLRRLWRLWLDTAYGRSTLLDQFLPDEHERAIERFRRLDRELIASGSSRLRRLLAADAWVVAGASLFGDAAGDEASALADLNTLARAAGDSEMSTLLREAHKKRKHMPLRRLFAQIPTLLRQIKPCVMTSPLAVSTYFDAAGVAFDVVVFDEASQVPPHDAVGAVFRGSQLVVAGDPKQLPPSGYFDKSDFDAVEDDEGDGEEEDGPPVAGTDDFESVLDACLAADLPRRRLTWHYRSRREMLIAFSNRHFYDGELVTFPSSYDLDGEGGVAFEHVAGGVYQPGRATNPAEADRLAHLVLDHARRLPERSLGVITLNQAQQVLVLERIDALRRQDDRGGGISTDGLDAFFDEDRPEPFFVKNLENVQGDERDHILLGVGFARDVGGRLSHNFGPLNRSGGERRLNVAVTRARHGLRLVSSMRAEDIDLSRTGARGAALLKAYLDYAGRGIAAFRGEIDDNLNGGRGYDSPFEAEVARALREQGLTVRPQIGCGGYHIDLGIVDENVPGRYALGVECDGATYHSAKSARDRDRLRQQVLESLGWRIVRVWSTDWIRGPERQVRRVIEAYRESLKRPRQELIASPPPVPRVEPQMDGDGGRVGGVVKPARPVPSYDRIDDVPTAEIDELVVSLLTLLGSAGRDDLARAVAQRLGFRRTGKLIRAGVDGRIDQLIGNDILVEIDGRLSVA